MTTKMPESIVKNGMAFARQQLPFRRV